MAIMVPTGQRLCDLPQDESLVGVWLQSLNPNNPQYGRIVGFLDDCGDPIVDIEWADGSNSPMTPSNIVQCPVVA